MRRRRLEIINELIEQIEKNNINHHSPRFAVFIKKYLKTKYKFRDNTIYDYIETIGAILREKERQRRMKDIWT